MTMSDFHRAESLTLVKWGKILTGIDDLGDLIDQSCEFCHQYRWNIELQCPAMEICGACSTESYDGGDTLYFRISKEQRKLRNSVEELIFKIGKLKPTEA